ncbi:hypothetical protein P691DRAFT_326802 [Macrolepiota fuliginosa MF-IS2]|uniref:Protein kinase domain-containing protein n=1 Tax=Macrolepiota fuliginosa MF-IS2 TaxID=1400762 RepID=A0A9P5X8B3_9AGAR|nr:hypothetical protein P691DRAFT_326802 [Macrolepiota fuliginosa MF-IS2]
MLRNMSGTTVPGSMPSSVDELPEQLDMHREAIADAARRRKKPFDVYTDRPCAPLAPFVGIYHPVFASFTRMMAIPPDQLEPRLRHEELDWGASLVSQPILSHPTKTDQTLGIREVLRRAVGPSVLGHAPLLPPTDGGSWDDIIPDDALIVVSARGLPIPCILITEEIDDGGSDPAARAACDYVAIYTSSNFKALRRISCCPALLFGIAGPRIIVCGATFTDRPIFQELTDYITLGSCTTTGDYHSGLDKAAYRAAQLLRGLREAFSTLGNYYNWNYYNLNIYRTPQFPQFPHFRTFSVDGSTVTVKYLERLDTSPQKAIFKARVVEVTNAESTAPCHLRRGEIVTIKFAYRYSKEAHSLLARQEPRLAPKLWHCQYEPTVDMIVIVMEFVDGYCLVERPAPSQRQFEALQKAVKILHENDFVFGDLREQNVLVPKEDENCMRLVDFDWCGKEGEVRYPSCIIMDEPGYEWHPTVQRGGLIRKEHDEHLLQMIMMNVGSGS